MVWNDSCGKIFFIVFVYFIIEIYIWRLNKLGNDNVFCIVNDKSICICYNWEIIYEDILVFYFFSFFVN